MKSEVFFRNFRTGRTTAMVDAVKNCRGILIVHDRKEANRIAEEFDIDAIDIESFENLKGDQYSRPILIDPHAVAVLLREKEKIIQTLVNDVRMFIEESSKQPQDPKELGKRWAILYADIERFGSV